MPMHHFSALAGAAGAGHPHDPDAGAHHRGDGAPGAATRCARRRWRWACRRGRPASASCCAPRSAGIVTAALLAIARAAGETAPLLFTALNNQYWNLRPDQPTASLTVQIFNYAISPYEDWHDKAWSAALVLLLLVGIAQPGARLACARPRRRSDRDEPARRSSPAAATDAHAQAARCRGSTPGSARHHALKRRLARRRSRAACWPSSARPAAASRPSCAASTACTSSSRGARSEGEVLLDGAGRATPRESTRSTCAAGWAWCSSGPTPSPPCRSSTTWRAGLRLNGVRRATCDAIVRALRCAQAALWDEVKDRLDARGASRSRAASSSGCASRARWRSSPRCC